MTHPPSPEELYDATIEDVWRLARCLHRTGAEAEDAVVHAFAVVARAWPRDLAEGRTRLLTQMTRPSGSRLGTAPAA